MYHVFQFGFRESFIYGRRGKKEEASLLDYHTPVHIK
jgi:hypothetical protein